MKQDELVSSKDLAFRRFPFKWHRGETTGKLNWKMSNESETDDNFEVNNIFIAMWDGMITILIFNINKRQIDVNNIHSEEVRAAKSALEKAEDNSLQVSIKTSDFFPI